MGLLNMITNVDISFFKWLLFVTQKCWRKAEKESQKLGEKKLLKITTTKNLISLYKLFA